MNWNWTDTRPFPYRVIGDLVDRKTIRAIHDEWPEHGWESHVHPYSDKRHSEQWEAMGPTTRSLISLLKSVVYLKPFRALTGIPDLSPDPYLHGEGLHETLTGGFLDVHVDFNKHPETELYRRLNLLVFLNEGWKEEWGGCLELWDGQSGTMAERIVPEAGRAVLFATSEMSFHGHPVKVNAPDGRPRRSLALYYYSEEPATAAKEHSTLYVEKGQIV